MTFETMLFATQMLLAFALLQQAAEHLVTRDGARVLFGLRIALCALLLTGVNVALVLGGLAVSSLVMLHRYQGPYNGGSDKMGVLVLWCLLAAQLASTKVGQEIAMGYLAVQLTLSYFISGRVKLANPEWRNGQALANVFAFSTYPVSEELRKLAQRPGVMWAASWGVIILEISFPLALLHSGVLNAALVVMGCFHLANACLFGLNRFLWIWLAAYPSLIWFQERIMSG